MHLLDTSIPALLVGSFGGPRYDGRSYPIIGGRVFEGVKNTTFDPVAPAGVLADYFRGNPNGDDPLELLRRHEPIRPEYRDRDTTPRHDGRPGHRSHVALSNPGDDLRRGTHTRPRLDSGTVHGV